MSSDPAERGAHFQPPAVRLRLRGAETVLFRIIAIIGPDGGKTATAARIVGDGVDSERQAHSAHGALRAP